ncbi:MAG: AraC family transcriptional regulator [Cyclobacteriaceae bacterium]
MLPLYRKVTLSSTQSFSAFIEQPPAFDTPWHYHPEYELILIQNCTGTRYMGDHIADFGHVELVLIGPNLPHFWKENMEYDDKEKYQAYVIHFSSAIIEHFLVLPEAVLLQKMLIDSLQGLHFVEPSEALLINIKSLFNKNAFDRYVCLLSLLEALTHTPYKTLSSPGFVHIFGNDDVSRIEKVMKFTIENYKQKILVEEVAAMVHMSKTAFCRYFKKRTGKRYYDMIKEMRIGCACRLLQQDKLDITAVSFESGYENLSNFNKQFKSITKLTPKEYRNQFRG